MNHKGYLLSHTCCGHVKMCATGCVHVTFGQVTLHLPSPEAFETLVQAIVCETETGEAFDFQYRWFSMTLSAHDGHEFMRLVVEAVSSLAWQRGDYEFTNGDLAEIRRRCAR